MYFETKKYDYELDCKMQQQAFSALPIEIQMKTFEYWALQKISTDRSLTKDETDRFFELAGMCVEYDITPVCAPDMYPF
jgi:hypothetical protein